MTTLLTVRRSALFLALMSAAVGGACRSDRSGLRTPSPAVTRGQGGTAGAEAPDPDPPSATTGLGGTVGPSEDGAVMVPPPTVDGAAERLPSVGGADAGTNEGGSVSDRDTGPDSPAAPPALAEFRSWRSITINTSASGGDVAESVNNYPLAILLDARSFDFAAAKPNGEDIRFATVDGVMLPHAIESWDPSNATAAIWVKIPVVLGNNANQTIRTYWGNATAVDTSDSDAVFSQNNGFVGVYHLAEASNGQAGGYRDASSHHAHATGVNLSPDSQVEGRIGKATNLLNPPGDTPAGRFIKMDDATKLAPFNTVPMGTAISISIWTKITNFPRSYETLMSKGDTSWTLQRLSTTTTYQSCVRAGSGTSQYFVCANTQVKAVPGQWVHLAAVYQEPRVILYVNGVQDAVMSGGGWNQTDHPLAIGNQTQFEANRCWNGIVDEARVSRGVRSPSWIKLDYESQREGQKLVTFGPITTRTASAGR